MSATNFQEIKNGLRELYLDDARPWLVGFSGGNLESEISNLNSLLASGDERMEKLIEFRE